MLGHWKHGTGEPRVIAETPLAAEFRKLKPHQIGAFCDEHNLRLQTKFTELGLAVSGHPTEQEVGTDASQIIPADDLPSFLKKDGLSVTGSEGFECISPAREIVDNLTTKEVEARDQKIALQQELMDLCRQRFAHRPIFDGFIAGHSLHYHAVDILLRLAHSKRERLQKLCLNQIGKRYRLEDTTTPPLNSSHPAFQLIRAFVLVDCLPVFSWKSVTNWNDNDRCLMSCEGENARLWVLSTIRQELTVSVFLHSKEWTEALESVHSMRNPDGLDQTLRNIQKLIEQRIEKLQEEIKKTIEQIRTNIGLPPKKPPHSPGVIGYR